MPIYSYRCPQCEEEFDKLVLMSEMNHFQPCPNRVAVVDPHIHKFYGKPEIVECGAPSKRLEVPSSPAAFLIR